MSPSTTHQGQNYVRNSAGVWTPIGYASGDSALPMTLTSPNSQIASLYAGVTSYGYLRATGEPGGIFAEPFDTLDTTNKWTLAGTVPPTLSAGRAVLAPATTASASASLMSQYSFAPNGLNFNVFGWIASFENISATTGTLFTTNNHRFMGVGSIPVTWVAAYTASAATGPLLDAIGFEIDVDGKLYPVVYANGVRARPALSLGGTDLNTGNSSGTGTTGGTRVLVDGSIHQFALIIRSDIIFWYVDGLDWPVASYRYSTAGFTAPTVQTQPFRFHSINATSVPGTAPQLNVGAIGCGDTGHNGAVITDATYGWRKAAVGKSGGLSVKGAWVAGVSASIAAAGTGTIGPLDVSEAGGVTFIVKNTVAASAFAGNPVLVFEQSDDGVSWTQLLVCRNDTGAANSQFTLAALGANVEMMFDAAVEGVAWVRVRVTTGPVTNAMTVVIQPVGMAFNPTVTAITNNPGWVTATGPTSVAAAAADTLLLASNVLRKGATVFNDSSSVLYLSLGTNAASATAYTVKMVAGGYYEVPFNYIGMIRGFWATANGSARVTEIVLS